MELINWKELMDIKEEEPKIVFDDALHRDSWVKAAHGPGVWKKVIKLKPHDGLNYYLAMNQNGNWCLYRSLIRNG